jgi:hypothetical protein
MKRNMKYCAVFCLVLAGLGGLTGGMSGSAEPLSPGSHGAITLEGAPGMFLNPTSGTLPRGQFAFNACVSSFQSQADTLTWGGALGTYGLSDDLELGYAWGRYDNHTDRKIFHVGGPALRWRFLRETSGRPEMAVGYVGRFGDGVIERQTGYLALSKLVSRKSARHGVRLHAGVRAFRQDPDQVGKWFASSLTRRSATIPYAGVSVALSRDFDAVGEFSGKGSYSPKTPWAIGVQFHRPNGFACTLSLMQLGYAKRPAVFFGIGIDLT